MYMSQLYCKSRHVRWLAVTVWAFQCELVSIKEKAVQSRSLALGRLKFWEDVVQSISKVGKCWNDIHSFYFRASFLLRIITLWLAH
jgi:hypothetical protein